MESGLGWRRLFDVQHAVLPTRLPLADFYAEFVRTQDILNKKHLGLQALYDVFGIAVRLLARGQTNFPRMLWKFGGIYNVDRLIADHQRPLRYEMRLPEARAAAGPPVRETLYVHTPAAATGG
ncbi:MAG TPA: hypothetical protein VL049_24790 [Candidatus Dormibacteraeota bacterium]|nr:hypothetical protein [Candidatus Dormibacteraeota bacterium]